MIVIESTYVDRCNLLRDSDWELVLTKINGENLNTDNGFLLNYTVKNLILHTSPQHTDVYVVYILYRNRSEHTHLHNKQGKVIQDILPARSQSLLTGKKTEQVEHFPSLSASWEAEARPNHWAGLADAGCCPGQLSHSTSRSVLLLRSCSGNPSAATSYMKDGGRKTEVTLPYWRCVRHRRGA